MILAHLGNGASLAAVRGGKSIDTSMGFTPTAGVPMGTRPGDLIERQTSDFRAAEAVELFCYQTRKWSGAFATVLGGLETLVFAGGIGENTGEVRARICSGLEFLGIELDEARNAVNSPVVSTEASPATVRVIRTDEELMIARAVCRLLREEDQTK